MRCRGQEVGYWTVDQSTDHSGMVLNLQKCVNSVLGAILIHNICEASRDRTLSARQTPFEPRGMNNGMSRCVAVNVAIIIEGNTAYGMAGNEPSGKASCVLSYSIDMPATHRSSKSIEQLRNITRHPHVFALERTQSTCT